MKIIGSQDILTDKILIAPELKKVQDLMPISSQDYKQLKDSIIKEGIKDPLRVYKERTPEGLGFYLLSGFNRLQIAKELNLKTVPIQIMEGEAIEREDFAIEENISRRHLNTEEKRKLIEYYLKKNPEASNLSLSKKIGVDDKTISKTRKEMESRSEIPNVKKKDSLGRNIGEKKEKQQTTINIKPEKNQKEDKEEVTKFKNAYYKMSEKRKTDVVNKLIGDFIRNKKERKKLSEKISGLDSLSKDFTDKLDSINQIEKLNKVLSGIRNKQEKEIT